MRISEIIRKLDNGKYRLYSKKGKNLGTYDTRSGAEKREQQVQYFKHTTEQDHIGHGTILSNPQYTLVIDTPGELDWYKLGQHFPTLDQQPAGEFGQSETDMMVTVASERELAKLKSTLARLKIPFKDISGSHEHPEIHSETIEKFINEWNLRQSDPLKVLDVLSSRNDNKEFPIRFYDGEIINVKPAQAKRFMDAYLQMDEDEKQIIHTYIKTKKGFLQAIKSLKINEDTSGSENIDGKSMLKIFQNMHHDAGNNSEMDEYILSHNWELRNFTPDMFPSEEEFFDYDDPFDRVIDIDYSHRVNLGNPIIVGPQYSDGKYSVIDGNHRAAAAQRAGKTIKGYFPVKKVSEAFDTDVEWVLDMDARNKQIFATKIDDAYIELTYKRIFPADVYISFTRGGSMSITGEGSQNKIFGAVINHIKQWVAENKPPRIIFSAFKPNTAAFGSKDTTRSSLYNKMVQRFASQNGYDYNVEDTGSEDTFILTKKQHPTQTNEAEGLGLTIFDIDETLMRTTAQIKVVKDGKTVRSLTNQEFNNYELQPGEEFDFGEFRNAEKFARESEPIAPMIAKLKAILRNAGDSRVIMLTARSDFDDKETFLDTFRKLGIDMSRVHVHRAGNLPGNPAENKEVFIRQYLDTGKYSRIRLYDDSMGNIRMFNALAKEYPDVQFYPYLVNHDGSIKTVRENFADGKVKGKSRPGRVKAAGASCKGSVTELRRKAKKYSGERGKMYHWCANMKSGKKK